MDEQQPISPRQRLKELLAIPERQRTDAEWDEINELEITLTPANREAAPEQRAPRNNTVNTGGRPNPGTGTDARDKKPARKLHKRPPKAGGPRRTP